MTKIRVTQVTFLDGAILIGGEPIDDATKVIVARADEPVGAILLAMAVATGDQPIVEPPDDSIVSILEKPM